MSAYLRPDQIWQPATFQERGVAVPFTTPALAGARLRRAARGVELIVPHPAGVRGVYIMACQDLHQFCAPTLHDHILAAHLQVLPLITPHSVRDAVLAVASQGSAGRPAQAAAATAIEAMRADRLTANIQFLQRLVHHQTGIDCGIADLDRHAKAAMHGLVPVLGRPGPAIAADIEALSQVLSGILVGAGGTPRCAQLHAALGTLVGELKEAHGTLEGRSAHAAALVLSTASATCAIAQTLLEHITARLQDPVGLLRAWIKGPAQVSATIQAVAWLLDGWAHTCLIWQAADIAARRSAVIEMALLVPVIPHQAAELAAIPVDGSAHQQLRGMVAGGQDWRSGGALFDLVARNELFLAMAA